MSLPKKITPDRIRESIVQVFFQTELPFDPLIGYLHSILGELGFTYTNEPIRLSSNTLVTNQPDEIRLNILPQHLYFNEEIKIQLHQNGSLIFNCINHYIGWSSFSAFIQSVLIKLSGQNIFLGYSRVGMRFISEFANIDILDKVQFSFSLKGLKKPYKNGSFKIEWDEDPQRVIVNLGLKLPIPNSMIQDGINIEYVSLIDIDVIQQDFIVQRPEELFKIIDQSHLKQKEIFFGLLTSDFLRSLNPEY